MRHASNKLMHGFIDSQVDFARLVGIYDTPWIHKWGWITKSYHAISSKLYQQNFLPHACFEFDDWMDYSQIELREGMVSRRKLWDAMVGLPINFRIPFPTSILADTAH